MIVMRCVLLFMLLSIVACVSRRPSSGATKTYSGSNKAYSGYSKAYGGYSKPNSRDSKPYSGYSKPYSCGWSKYTAHKKVKTTAVAKKICKKGKIDLTICVNWWYYYYKVPNSVGVDELCLISADDTLMIDDGIWEESAYGNCFPVKKHELGTENWLIAVKPSYSGGEASKADASTGYNLKGNITIMDCNGHTQTREVSDLTNVKDYKGNRYYFQPTSQTATTGVYMWDEAQAFCEESMNGNLASICSQDEFDFIADNAPAVGPARADKRGGTLLGGYVPTPSNQLSVWKMTMEWIDESDTTKFPGLFDSTNWDQNQPDAHPGGGRFEDHLEMFSLTGKLNDVPANLLRDSFVCKTSICEPVSPPLGPHQYWLPGCICGGKTKNFKPLDMFVGDKPTESEADELCGNVCGLTSSMESGSMESGSMESGSMESGSMKSSSMESGSMESGSMESGSMETGCMES